MFLNYSRKMGINKSLMTNKRYKYTNENIYKR